MLTKITSAADRMMGSWIVAAVLLVLLAVASVTGEGNDPLAGMGAGMDESPLAASDEAAPVQPSLASLASPTDTLEVAVVDLDAFTPPEN